MLTKAEIFETIHNNRVAIRNLGIKEVGLFGSYVRNEQHKNSDIDILIDYEKGKMNLFKLIELDEYFQSLFNTERIDIVTKNSLSEFIGPYILKEVEYAKI